MAIRVVLAEDHQLVREGLRALLERESDIKVVGEAEDGRMMVSLALKVAPDVVVADVTMPNLNGTEATLELAAANSRARVIALSMYSDNKFVARMLRAGAAGYVPKDCAFHELAQAIRTVAAGHIYLSPKIADDVVRSYVQLLEKTDSSPFSTLTTRERRVLQLLAEGRTTRETASLLFLSLKTVETHRTSIMRKLDFRTTTDLIRCAIREGLVPLDS